MGYEAKKTEHSGPKRGNGAYRGYKWEAKKESNRVRRENAKREIRASAIEAISPSISCIASPASSPEEGDLNRL